MNGEPALEVRPFAHADLSLVMPLLAQLRPHLDEASFERHLADQEGIGYQLYVARLDGRIVGLAGMRRVSTLARGPHLHLDDLVIDEAYRGRGLGRRLLEFAEEEARRRGLGKLFLDARQEAIPFYERNGYGFHRSPLMSKDV